MASRTFSVGCKCFCLKRFKSLSAIKTQNTERGTQNYGTMFAHIWKAMLPQILLIIMAASTLHLRAIFQWGSHNSLLVQDIYIYIYICILHFKGSFKIKVIIKNNKTTRRTKFKTQKATEIPLFFHDLTYHSPATSVSL